MCGIKKVTFHCGHVDRSIIYSKKCKDFSRCVNARETKNQKYNPKVDVILTSSFDCFECRELAHIELVYAGKKPWGTKRKTREESGETPLDQLIHAYGQDPRKSWEGTAR